MNRTYLLQRPVRARRPEGRKEKVWVQLLYAFQGQLGVRLVLVLALILIRAILFGLSESFGSNAQLRLHLTFQQPPDRAKV